MTTKAENVTIRGGVGEAEAGEPTVGTNEMEIADASYEVRGAKTGGLPSGARKAEETKAGKLPSGARKAEETKAGKLPSEARKAEETRADEARERIAIENPGKVKETGVGESPIWTKETETVKTRDETRKAIVVGASSGIGREMCRLLLADGWRIGIAARRGKKLEEIRQMNPEMVEVAVLDVTAEDCTLRLAELISRLGGMDLYFHISGVGHQNKELEPSIEEKTVATNALGFTRMIDYVFNLFAKQGYGHIAVISSIAGTRGLGSCPSYSATKAYQSTYIESLEQLSSIRRLKNIRFTDIRPGFIMTDLIRDGQSYPMVMPLEYATPRIYKAVMKGRHNVVIDWRWAVAVFFWKLIPRPLWRRWRLVSGSSNSANK